MGKTLTTRDRIEKRLQAMRNERSGRDAQCREVSEVMCPTNARFFVSDKNQEKKFNKIPDSTATQALRTCHSGLMSYVSSPAREWFSLAIRSTVDQTSTDYEQDQSQNTKVWVKTATDKLLRIMQRANVYPTLHHTYKELLLFGTAASIILPDKRNVLHCYPLTWGQYWIACDSRDKVDTLYREFDMTVAQVIEEFAEKNEAGEITGRGPVSVDTWRKWQDDLLDSPVTVVQAIEPRRKRDSNRVDAKNMPWASIYYESAAKTSDLLRESGFPFFPAIVPRWDLAGGDTYGSSPAFEVIGDVRQLHHEQNRKALAIDYQTRPPLQAPSSLANRDVEMLPGGITYVDSANPQAGIRPMWETNLRIDYLTADIEDVRARIRSGFYADLFLMLANAGVDTRMTATEIVERHEEKLVMLGPAYNRLKPDALEPLIEIAFAYALEAGEMPPVPPELSNAEWSIEFVSILEEAMRAVGVNSQDRFIGSMRNMIEFMPDIRDRLNADGIVDSYARRLMVDPTIVYDRATANQMRQARAKMQAAQAQNAAMEQASKSVKNLANSPMGEGNALGALGSALSGYSAPGVL